MALFRRFLALPARLQRLLAGASILLVFFRVAMIFVPFRHVQRMASSLGRRKSSAARLTTEIGWAVAASGRALRIENCLSQALTAHVLLLRSDHDPEIRVGVARDADGRFSAHAWVESDGSIVVGDDERGRFEPVLGPGRLV
jgi:hypothetical protein